MSVANDDAKACIDLLVTLSRAKHDLYPNLICIKPSERKSRDKCRRAPLMTLRRMHTPWNFCHE